MSLIRQLNVERKARLERMNAHAVPDVPINLWPNRPTAIPDIKKIEVTTEDEPEASVPKLAPPVPDSARPINIGELESRIAKLEWQLTSCMQHLIRSPVNKAHEERVTISDIRDAVCRFYGCSTHDLDSQARDARSVRPRHIGIYLARTLTTRGFPFIARAFNRHDHSTASHAYDRIFDLMKDDDDLRDEITTITEMILNRQSKAVA